MKDRVAVIGAGTAGLMAANRLCELGIDTEVYDRSKTPGYPVRASGILSISGLGTLGVDYKKVMTNALCGARLHIGRELVRIKARKPMAYVLERHELNNLLLEESKRLGANVMTGAAVNGALLDRLSKDRIIVGADGAVSTVAKHFGFPPIGRQVLTYRAEYDYELADSEMVDLFFDNKITPGFFGWICPNSSGIAEIGIGIDSKYGNSRSSFEKFKKIGQVDEIVKNGRLITEGASFIPIGMREHFVKDREGVLLVGDAAGQVKPTTGGGIIFGGNGARYAAGAIKNHLESGAKLSEYERMWRKEFQKEVGLHSFFYNLYSSLDGKSLERIARAIKFFGLDSFLGKYGDMDRPSVVIKRFFLRGLAK
ncbi:MAG: NAD(P)/FAD-dependent oxidoreductase [Candidatus Micrarchaeota archaeon]|nr:NAD(P)/FAD-dependent oxidoreductase [Candidatus Micrarchaeota archaeon]